MYTYCILPVSDLQLAARRYCRAGRSSSRPPHHRDQRSECGGRAARADREPAGHLCRGDPHEDDAHLHVPAPHGTGDTCLHLDNWLGTTCGF